MNLRRGRIFLRFEYVFARFENFRCGKNCDDAVILRVLGIYRRFCRFINICAVEKNVHCDIIKSVVKNESVDQTAQLEGEKVMKNLKTWVFTAFTVFFAVLMLNSCGKVKYDDQGLKYTENSDGTYTVSLGWAKKLSEITVPDTFNEKKVTAIAENGFAECEDLTAVYLPEGLTIIGRWAFARCTKLEEAVIPETVEKIYTGAFYECVGLIRVQLGEALTYIGEDAFGGCTALADVSIPDGVTVIGEGAFRACPIKTVHIPDGVTEICDRTFSACSELERVMGGRNVNRIGRDAFFYCDSLRSVELSEYLTVIGDHAFDGCFLLGDIALPDTVTEIGSYAFQSCKALGDVELPQKLRTVGSYAFMGCSFTVLEIPISVYSIGDGAFMMNTLKEVTLSPNIAVIPKNAFSNCAALESVTIPKGVGSIEGYAFYLCESLVRIYYGGTEAEWSAIAKGEDWDLKAGSYTVVFNAG